MAQPLLKASSSTQWSQFKGQITPYLFLLPALTVLGLAVFWPAIQAFILSFSEFGYDITAAPEWVGLKNFRRLWGDPVFWKTLANTVLYLIFAVPILVVAPLGLAILVNQKLRGIQWFRTAYYTPVVISMVVAGIAWKWLYTQNGLLNQLGRWGYGHIPGMAPILNWLAENSAAFQAFLGWLNLSEEGIPWLTNPNLALFCVMAVTIWKGLGYYMVIYLAGLQAIPVDLYEAAAIDGSQGWQRHWDITVPLMTPYLMLVAVISAISATKVFEEIYIMTRGEPLNSSKTIVYYLYEQAFGPNLDISYACAMGLVLYLIIFSLSVLNLWLRRRI
ncbi:carbohydrate ABC transporter permease [Lyngbya confervoides]|uniref:Sugar ABC transporter permease n=1 Tax=Lyngbya confervoides BDU141951 TaxID=1574623 RepID=A0ABD4T2Z3_9CYAN|nr:sugar ABC transporter permease [Lyngbya confervoides]MCM1982853.1 sugar ABC transporter permease [Lyngbya confervoides BDU141951]